MKNGVLLFIPPPLMMTDKKDMTEYRLRMYAPSYLIVDKKTCRVTVKVPNGEDPQKYISFEKITN